MILEIGKIYKLKCDGTAFFRVNDEELVRKDAGDLVLFLGNKKFLDIKKTNVVWSTSMLLKDPSSYLYLYV